MSVPSEWLDKLEIREVIERSMRYIDDRDGGQLAALFDEDDVKDVRAARETKRAGRSMAKGSKGGGGKRAA